MEITPQTQISEIVIHNPAATRVFHRHGIDFCCGGKRPLAQVCEERRLDVDEIRREIAALDPNDAEERDWSATSLTEIVHHILERYHAPLKEELPRLAAMAEKVRNAHGAKFPDIVPPLANRVAELRAELESHMMKEEHRLFPYVESLERTATEAPQAPFDSIAAPIAVMEAEHEDAGRLLAEMRSLTHGYELPAGACNTFRALYHGLAELESEMHLHVHLENYVLFPRAAELERTLTA